MKFDRKKFYDGYRAKFGGLSQQQVNGLNQLLDFIEADKFITRREWAAYMLATAMGETAFTFHPIHEFGGRAYFIGRYGGQTKKGRELGNDTPEEGALYAGMGYPQTTGESNYEKAEAALRREYPELISAWETKTGKKFDLTVGDQPNDSTDPRNMMYPEIAYATMSYGMRTGMFTGKKLPDYFSDTRRDPFNARRIINGLDHAQDYVKRFEKFDAILKDALITS